MYNPTDMVMRVLHVIQSLQSDANAPAIALSGLWFSLRRDGVDLRILTDEPGTESALESAIFDPDTVAAQLSDVALVHIHGWRFQAARAVAAAARQRKVPYIISAMGALSVDGGNGNGWRSKLRGWLGGNTLVRNAAAVIALNQAEADDLRHRSVNPRVEILPLGLDLDEYPMRSAAATTEITQTLSPDASRVLLVLAPVEPKYGGVPLLKALAELGTDADGWKVVFAGPQVGDWRKMLEAAIQRKGGADRVHFTAAADASTQIAWLQRASLLAACHLTTAPNVSFLQALACSVPILATKFAAPDGLNNVVELVEPNRSSIREGLRTFLKRNDRESRELGGRSRERARSSLDWSTLTAR